MLSLENIHLSFGETEVLHDLSLEVDAGEILCLLGGSGSGKTTLLRVVAGLEADYSGSVQLNGKAIDKLPVQQRDVGLMFQDFALFPHLNVIDNVSFGLRMANTPQRERNARAAELLELVGLAGYADRDVTELSGGERQRVALARSLARTPRLLMLDEPLGSLDALLRDRLVIDLRQIIKSVGLTAIYVTHDQKEAFAVADRIALMRHGSIARLDTPQQIYRFPRSVYVARFLGLQNVIPVADYKAPNAQTTIGTFSVDAPATHILLHPDGLSVSDAGTLRGEVTECVFEGRTYRLTVRVGDSDLLVFVRADDNHLTRGDVITLQIDPDFVVPLVDG